MRFKFPLEAEQVDFKQSFVLLGIVLIIFLWDFLHGIAFSTDYLPDLRTLIFAVETECLNTKGEACLDDSLFIWLHLDRDLDRPLLVCHHDVVVVELRCDLFPQLYQTTRSLVGVAFVEV